VTTEITDTTGWIRRAAVILVAGTWLTHGLYNKLLHGSSRHLAIVQSVPGLSGPELATQKARRSGGNLYRDCHEH